MTVNRRNITLEVTNPMVKEDLVGKLGEIFAAASGWMKWKYPHRGATTTGPDATYPPAICQNSGGGGGRQLGGGGGGGGV